jgi:hypothetical protein
VDALDNGVKNALFRQNLHLEQNHQKSTVFDVFLTCKIAEIFIFDAKSSKTDLTPPPPISRSRARARRAVFSPPGLEMDPPTPLWALHLEVFDIAISESPPWGQTALPRCGCVVARFAHSLQVRLIKEEALIAAVLVDILPGCDNVVNNPAQRRLRVDRVDHTERIPRQHNTTHGAPDLGLI